MASKKKHSEGIALLSMYNDEEDDEMEVDDEEEDARIGMEEDAAADARFAAEEDSANRTAVLDSGKEAADEGASTPQNNNFVSPPPEEPRISRKGALTIVDYGHDEVAMSPEPEVPLCQLFEQCSLS